MNRIAIAGIAGPALIALVTGMLGAGAASGHPAQAQPTEPVAAAESPSPALGVIVKRSGSRAALTAAAVRIEQALPGVEVVATAGVMPGVEVLTFAREIPGDDAARVAAEIAGLPGVEWAEPDYLRYLDDVTPVLPSDPLWRLQWDMWDADRFDGGYGVKAPYAWATTTGSPEVVVAVLDTGITDHGDLNANVVAGYDFVNDPRYANDNDPVGAFNSRDPNPADPGDWITQAEIDAGTLAGCRAAATSSWHGTHVAGTIAAIQNNDYGMSGVAPGVRIQPVRVGGRCGRISVSDLAAAITWASGGTVTGIPANATPADVINLSLGGAGTCTQSEQAAITAAIGRGVTVVAAAGNRDAPVSGHAPANCTGVIRVGSTNRAGALSSFSNFGVPGFPLTIAAPGGDGNAELVDEIWSTFNSGRTVPGLPTFAAISGTSMAAPHVSGAAALLYSRGVTDPSEIATRLQAAVRPMSEPCTVVTCGPGILDLSRLFPEDPDPGPIGAPTDISWAVTDPGRITVEFAPPSIPGGARIDSYVIDTSADGQASWTRYGSVSGEWEAFAIDGIPLTGTHYYRFAAILADGRQGQFSSVIGPVTFEPVIDVPGRIDPDSVAVTTRKRNGRYIATARWARPVGPVTGYQVRLRSEGASWGAWQAVDRRTFRIRRLPARTAYRMQVLAVNAAGSGPVTGVRFRTGR